MYVCMYVSTYVMNENLYLEFLGYYAMKMVIPTLCHDVSFAVQRHGNEIYYGETRYSINNVILIFQMYTFPCFTKGVEM